MNDSSSAQDSYSEKEIGLICSDNATASTCPNGHNQVMENHQNVDINDQQSPKPTDSEQTTVSQISVINLNAHLSSLPRAPFLLLVDLVLPPRFSRQ